MARDNGSRGSYRHVSASTTEHEVSPRSLFPVLHRINADSSSLNLYILKNPRTIKKETQQQQQQQRLISPTSSPATATPPTTFQNLHRDSIDGSIMAGANADRLFDLAPELLNVRFPSMSQQQRSVPGSMPRPSLFPQTNNAPEDDHHDRVSWVDIAIANLVLGSAAIGFLVIMYDGVGTTASFLWSGIVGMVMSH